VTTRLGGVRRLLALTCVALGVGCEDVSDDPVAPVEVWAHAGQAAERRTLEDQARRFNELQDSFRVELEFIPEGSYNAQVQASAVADRLPDLLELDGPYVAQYAWQGRLRSLDPFLTDSLLATVLPSILEQGSWRGALYAVGTFDSGLGLYASARALLEAGARIPEGPAEAWTVAELERILRTLSETDPDGAVLDLKLNYSGEWFTYAFQPALRSAGGGLVGLDEESPVAGGVLDGRATRRALESLQSWIVAGLVDPNLDDRAFVDGRVALSWSGHWDFPRYADALGDDLAVLPLPDYGQGTRTGQGSWTWTVPRSAEQAEGAAAFLRFLLRPEEVLRMTGANGAVPGTRPAAEASALYGADGPLHVLLRQLEGGWSVPRPRTPVYPFASSVFQEVFRSVRDGASLEPVLEEAAEAIDREILDNRGYPPT
jgi:multiple sugar transport system substrate-binding protein